MQFDNPHDALRHHVSGAIERGEKEPIYEVPAGHIETIRADELRVGDVFSTDGSIGQYLERPLFGGDIYVETIRHGVGKSATLEPDFPCHLWREGSDA